MAREYDWKPVFLAALKNSGNVRAACHAAGISRQHAYRTRGQLPGFCKDWDRAVEEAVDLLEAEAWMRARGVEGRGPSDTLLIFLLKAHRSMYREAQRMEVSAPGGGPVQILTVYDALAHAVSLGKQAQEARN